MTSDHEGPGNFQQVTIFMLDYPIFLRSIRARTLVEDTMVLKVVIKGMRKVFFTIVSA